MSRTGAGRPEYRLRFGYPFVTVERVGAPLRRVPIDGEDPHERLRVVAAEIARARGRLTAVLPESEAWRGFVPAQGAAEAARRAGARALGVAPAEVAVVLGRAGPDGSRAAAVARRETVSEARAFLVRAGLRPAAITAGADFPGFAAPPAFRTGLLAGRAPSRPAMAASGLAAALALTLWLAPWRPEAPEAPAPAVAALPAPPVVAEAPALPAAQPVLQEAAAAPAPAAPPAAAAPAPQMTPLAIAARNMPDDLRPPPAVAEVAAGRAGQAALPTSAPPRPRPAAAMAQPDAAAGAAAEIAPRPRPDELSALEPAAPLDSAMLAAAPLDAALLELGPRARPASAPPAGAQVASLAAATDAAPALADDGPLPRPDGLSPAAPEAPVRVAALDPSPETLAALAATALDTPPAQRPPAAAAPAPATPAFVRPAQQRQGRAQPVAAAPAAQPAPIPVERLRPAPAPAAPQAVRLQPAAPAAAVRQPRREPAQVRRPRLDPEALALIGIFGGADGRHALVQLPSGETERVRQGDEVQGVQVTAVAADAVHLRGGGGDTVLKLPN